MSNNLTIAIACGEVSGDRYGAQVIERLLTKLSSEFTLQCYGIGGASLKACGVELVADITPFAAVGLSEQKHALKPVRDSYNTLKQLLVTQKPDLLLLIDYQGANIPLGRFARGLGIPVHYFIGPQTWLWRLPGELGRLNHSIDELYAIFPPELNYYQDHAQKVRFNVHGVGHPLIEKLDAPLSDKTGKIALMPGSRVQEIEHQLPLFLKFIRQIAPAEALGQLCEIPVAAQHLRPIIQHYLGLESLDIPLVETLDLKTTKLAIASSGTTILECALFGIPVIATYHLSLLSRLIAKPLYQRPYFTIPNLILETGMVPEIFPFERPEQLMDDYLKLEDPDFQKNYTQQAYALRRQLKHMGDNPIAQVADRIVSVIQGRFNV
jgi:lipid-A-disaccharide synthase